MDLVKMIKDFQCAVTLQYAAGGVNGIKLLFTAIGMKLCKGIYTRVGSGRKYCPCCGWKGTNFLPYIDAGYVGFQGECPSCKSHQRHRAHALFYQRHFPDICGDLLYIAPEKNVDYFRSMASLQVRTSEYLQSAPTDFHYDLLNIDSPDSTWDFIVCHRVIEHVADDCRAMRELYRILKPGGICLISVPIDFSLTETIRYDAPNPFESDHFYRYGTDFPSRIPDDFEVIKYEFKNLFSAEEFEALHLYDDMIFVCRKSLIQISSVPRLNNLMAIVAR